MTNASAPPKWGRIALAAYGPTLLSSVGFGAVAPLVALSARDMGASVGLAAFITGLVAIGQLVGDLPAGWAAERLGEKRALVLACLVNAGALMLAYVSTNLWLLSLAVFLCGPAGSMMGLARQTYLTEAIPLRARARALSTLGGVFRIGGFLGPLLGAAAIVWRGLSTAYLLGSLMCLLAAVVTLALPDLPGENRGVRRTPGHLTMSTVVRANAKALATLGTGALAIMLVRAARQAILPLWCEAHGLSADATSLVFAVSMGFDVTLFFLGGSLMDRFGRIWVAGPAMLVMGAGLLLLPLATTTKLIIVVAAVLGLGNGISSGVVMTLGSDASPSEARTKFLAAWRLVSDTGNMLGPLAISAISLVAPLAAASVVLGLFAWAGAAWLWKWVPGRSVLELRRRRNID